MKIGTIAAAALGLLLATGSAQAADVYNQGGGLKDGAFTPDTRSNHTGWSARVFIGYAMGDRDINNDAQAFLNCTNVYEIETDPEAREAQLDYYAEKLADYKAAGVFASNTETAEAGKFVVPIIGALFSNSDSDDFNSLVLGAEVEHLWHAGQFGLGLAVGVTGYADADSKSEFKNVPTQFASGTLFNPAGNPGLDGDTGYTVSGYSSIERQFDIDTTLKLYYFPSNDLAFYVKAGPSFAFATVKGGVSVDGEDAGLDYENDDVSIGYVLGGGVVKWIKPDWSLGADIDWKKHSFSAGGKHSESLGKTHCCDDISVDAGARTDVDDSVWTIKANTAYHF